MQTPLPISCFIIARNEADRIEHAIRSVRDLVDEVVVVVDSSSSDGTDEVAARLGAVVVKNEWQGYGPQKRFAEDCCRNNWLLNIDADETVTPELSAEIHSLFATSEPAADGYEIAIVDVFPGEIRPHRYAYKLIPVRLYRRDRGRYKDSPVHDRVAFPSDAHIERLKGIMHHRSIRSLAHQISKLDRYSSMQADDFIARGRRLLPIRVFSEFPLSFLKAWIGRRLLLRGTYGFLVAMNYAIYRHMRVAKIFEKQRNDR